MFPLAGLLFFPNVFCFDHGQRRALQSVLNKYKKIKYIVAYYKKMPKKLWITKHKTYLPNNLANLQGLRERAQVPWHSSIIWPQLVRGIVGGCFVFALKVNVQNSNLKTN